MKSFATLAMLLCLCARGVSLGGEARIAKRSERTIRLELALYFAPKPLAEPEGAVARIVKERFPGVSLRGAAAEATLSVTWAWFPTKEYAPPDRKTLKYFSHGVSEEQARKMAAAERVFVLTFAMPRDRVITGNRDACALVADAADATAGYPWDEEARLLFDSKTWRKERVASWHEDIPRMSQQIGIHAYRDGELFRVITLGMRKFGQPDIVVTDVASSHTRSMGNLINACAQLFVEGSAPKRNGFIVDFAFVKHPEAREQLQADPRKGAVGKAVIGFAKAKPDEGDPDNELLSIEFPASGAAGSINERHAAVLAGLFGADDSIVNVEADNKELQAASRKARERAVRVIKPLFEKELASEEQILAKFPFATADGGKEYMWVEIVAWNGGAITGILQNDPFDVPKLKAGARVTLQEGDLFDYIWRKSDGTVEGNETAKIIERMEKE